MKKSLFIVAALVAVSFASCKKDRKCECVHSSDQPGDVSYTEVTTFTKAKKSVCVSSSTVQTAPSAPSGTTYYTYKSTCSLK
ncbi:MAG: hypothetical protein ACJ76F_03755 [Bacteroidia bacterium]